MVLGHMNIVEHALPRRYTQLGNAGTHYKVFEILLQWLELAERKCESMYRVIPRQVFYRMHRECVKHFNLSVMNKTLPVHK